MARPSPSRKKAPIDLPSRHEYRRPYLGKRARLCLAPVSLAYLSLFALAMSLVLLLTNLQDQVSGRSECGRFLGPDLIYGWPGNR